MAKELLLPVDFIHQSFRYVLGRMTYAVSDWCKWCIENWDRIPFSSQNIIMTELEQAFSLDEREKNNKTAYFYPLGHSYDKKQWEKVRALWNK